MVARDVVPVLRSAGYHGTGGTWSLTSPIGDPAIVNLQKSKWNTAAEVAFTVNLSLVPRPWYEWFQREYGHRSSRKIREYDGLWRDRLHPSQRVPQGGTEFWLIKSEADATACGADVAAQLIRAGLPRLSALLDRDQLLRAIRAGFGFMKMPPRQGSGHNALGGRAKRCARCSDRKPGRIAMGSMERQRRFRYVDP